MEYLRYGLLGYDFKRKETPIVQSDMEGLRKVWLNRLAFPDDKILDYSAVEEDS